MSSIDKSENIAKDNILENEVLDVLSDDGTIKYDFTVPLTHITAVEISCNLLMNANIQQEMINLFHNNDCNSDHCFKFGCNKWMLVEDMINSKMSELGLPEDYTKMLKNIVQLLGKSLCDWIHYHDSHIFEGYSAVDFIENIKWTSRGRISCQETAKHILAREDTILNNDCKYKLACAYCLEDEIVKIAPYLLSPQYLNGINIFRNPMVFFWTAHITGDDTKIYEELSDFHFFTSNDGNVRVNEVMLELLCMAFFDYEAFCEIAFEYLWNTLNEEEKIRNIPTILGAIDKQDFGFSALSSLNYENQQEVFKRDEGDILHNILQNWLMEKYTLPTAIYILDYIRPIHYLHLLLQFGSKMMESFKEGKEYDYTQYKIMLKKLCQVGSKKIKDVLSGSDEENPLVHAVIVSFSWGKDMDMIDLILRHLTVKQRKFIILSPVGIRKCVEIIQQNQWNLLEFFIKHTLPPDEELKESIIKNGEEMVMSWISIENWDDLNFFLNWAFNSEEELKQFKRNLPRNLSSEGLSSINVIEKWCNASL